MKHLKTSFTPKQHKHTHTDKTDQLLNPGVVSWWADGHLDDSGRDENDKTERGDILPKVEIDNIRSET